MKTLTTRFGWLAILATLFAQSLVAGQVPTIVTFTSGTEKLDGFLFKPAGPGPFPVVLWNHSNPKPIAESGDIGRFDELTDFFVNHGYILFIPDHRCRLLLEGSDSRREQESGTMGGLPENLERNHADIEAAISWLKQQPYADKNRIAMSGFAGGAVQAIYEAGRSREPGIRAFVVFSPGSRKWNKLPYMRELVPQSVENAKAPVFALQAQNDFGIEAMAVLSKQLATKGKPNKAMVYAPHGNNQKEANLFALTGTKVWGDDVLGFLQETMRN